MVSARCRRRVPVANRESVLGELVRHAADPKRSDLSRAGGWCLETDAAEKRRLDGANQTEQMVHEGPEEWKEWKWNEGIRNTGVKVREGNN